MKLFLLTRLVMNLEEAVCLKLFDPVLQPLVALCRTFDHLSDHGRVQLKSYTVQGGSIALIRPRNS